MRERLFQLVQQRRLRFPGAAAQLEPERQHFDELVPGQHRVLDVHAVHPRGLPLQRRSNERGLPSAGLADEQRDARAAGDAVLQVAQRLPVDVGHHQETRVRRQIERPLPEAVERLVHQRNQRSTSCSRHTTITAAASAMQTPMPTPRAAVSACGRPGARWRWSSPG